MSALPDATKYGALPKAVKVPDRVTVEKASKGVRIQSTEYTFVDVKPEMRKMTTEEFMAKRNDIVVKTAYATETITSASIPPMMEIVHAPAALDAWYTAHKAELEGFMVQLMTLPESSKVSWFSGNKNMLVKAAANGSRSRVPVTSVPPSVFLMCLSVAKTFEDLPFSLTGLSGEIDPFTKRLEAGGKGWSSMYLMAQKARIAQKILQAKRNDKKPNVTPQEPLDPILEQWSEIMGININTPKESVFYGKLIIGIPHDTTLVYQPLTGVLQVLKSWNRGV